MFAAPPNLADFTAFLNRTLRPLPNNGGVVLPSQDEQCTAFQMALNEVSGFIQIVPTQYVEAVYNLAAHRVVYLAKDTPPQTYFRDMRRDYRMGDLSVGVVSSASNHSSSVGQINPKNLQELTLNEISLMKTFWGLRYLEIAQSFGSEVFGVS